MARIVDNARPDAADPTLGDRITRRLRDAIITGELEPGVKLSEPDLAARYDTRRGSVREALHRLEGMRLVERRARIGARVAEVSREDVIDLYAIREALEGMACRLAAEHMTPDEITDVRRLLSEHEQRDDVRADTGYFQDEGPPDFHFRLVQGGRNGELAALLDALSHRVRMYRYRSSHISHRPQRALKEHHQVLDAVEASDPDLAEMLMRRHIRAARESIVAGLPEV